MSSNSRAATILLVLAFLAGTFALSRVRPIDGDEGYYAPAARLVSEGRAPYSGFFYPQAPLMPYVYAPWYRVVGDSIAGMRGLSVLAGVLSMWLWASFLRRRWGDQPWLVLTGFLLVALNPYFLSWNVTVKTYALTNLCVFAAIWAVDRARDDRRMVYFAVAGLAAVLAAGVRLLYLPWAVVLVLGMAGWAFFDQGGLVQNGVKPKHALAALGGAVVGGLPVLFIFAKSPELFWFNNLEYHQLRFSPNSAEGVAFVAALGVLAKAFVTNPYLLMTLVLTFGGVAWLRANPDHPHRSVILLTGVAADVFVLTSLLPDPAYEQYFTGPLTPMMAPAAVAGLAWLSDRMKRWKPVMAGALVLMVALSAFDLGVRGTGMDFKDTWSFEHLAKVKESIQRNSKPDDPVLAFWSGYVFESGRQFVPGMENHFALGVSEKLDLEKKIAYKVAGKEVLLKALEMQYPELVVLGAWMNEVNSSLDQRAVPLITSELSRRYLMIEVFGETKVTVRDPNPPPTQ